MVGREGLSWNAQRYVTQSCDEAECPGTQKAYDCSRSALCVLRVRVVRQFQSVCAETQQESNVAPLAGSSVVQLNQRSSGLNT
jgi:hypothetical protein